MNDQAMRKNGILLVALLAAATARGDDLFVDDDHPNASDGANNCLNPAAPCRSISHSLIQSSMGDRVLVQPGLYSQGMTGESFPLRIKRGVTLIGVQGLAITRILDDDNNPNPLRSFTVYLPFDGSPPVPSTPTAIEGFTIDGAGLSENRIGAFIEAAGADVPEPGEPSPYIRDCRFESFTSPQALGAIMVRTWGFGARVHTTTARIERNEVWSATTGITVVTMQYDQNSGARDASILQNNSIVDGGTGIMLRTEWDPINPGPTGLGLLQTTIRNNTIIGSDASLGGGDGIVMVAEDGIAGKPAVVAEISSNLIAHNAGLGVREDVGDGSARYREADASGLYSNLFFNNAGGGYFDNDSGGVYTTAVELQQIPDLVALSSGNLDVDPLVDLASGRLPLNSPCREQGFTGGYPGDDIERQRRAAGAAPDIGADEVAPLLRGYFVQLYPLRPTPQALFANLDEYIALRRSPYADPEINVLDDDRRPLVVYRLPLSYPMTLFLTKDVVQRRVMIGYTD